MRINKYVVILVSIVFTSLGCISAAAPAPTTGHIPLRLTAITYALGSISVLTLSWRKFGAFFKVIALVLVTANLFAVLLALQHLIGVVSAL